jgi:aldose 1-epimerase
VPCEHRRDVTRQLRLQHPHGLALSLSTLGAAWLSCSVPLPDGSRRSVILQRVEPPDAATLGAYVGATVGRYANRIAQARITDGVRVWSLDANPGSRHQLHGGPHGFHAREWTVDQADESSARLSIVSADGDQGYPGELHAQVVYRLADAMTIEMEASASVSAASPVCLTNHAYFNLDAGGGDVRQHRLHIAAERYLPVDAELIPLGPLADVSETGFDFRVPQTLQAHWLADEQQRQAGGYDHAYLLDPACADMAEPAAVLQSADGALSLQISTTLPAIQLYAGQFLGTVPTRAGGSHPAFAGMALEPQFLPDSPNHPEWPQPSCWLREGETYRHTIRYRFSAA